MRFLGVDFGWRSQPSGVAAYAGGSVRAGRIDEPAAVLDWIDAECGSGPAIVAVDAPLVIPNETGMRVADKLMHVHFGRYHAGCYPANRRLPFADRVLAFADALSSRGFTHADRIEPGIPGRYQIEVYPHVASVNLFRLDQILKYKKGRLAERRVELRRYREQLGRLVKRGLPPVPDSTGAALKACEDQLDAALCAYVGWLWWTYGEERSAVYGDQQTGYVVAPRRPEQPANSKL